ncbi:hypothetical protein GGS20DRAFT_583626 [Poronia punctata]|nr:hypothetical protein GGS20DRAFT_583626 [Poronia punctata]
MSDNTPLLASPPDAERNDEGGSSSRLRHARLLTRRFFTSRTKHWMILTLVIFDIAGILTDIFIGLITCELGRDHEPWVTPSRNALTTFSLVMSCIFMVELALSVFADGLGFFSEWFHCMDAFVIAVGFTVDLLEHGVVGEIASLVVVLRLWRFVKIVEEFSVEQSEQTEELRHRIRELEKNVRELEAGLASST